MTETPPPLLEEALPSAARGLSSAEAAARLARFGPNEPSPRHRRAAIVEYLLLFTDPLTLTLLIAAGVAATLGEFADSTLIIVIVFLSTTVNFLQFYRSRRAADRLLASIVPTARVLRDGTWQSIPRAQLVPGDIVQLAAGDLVPADARLIEANHLYVQQAALTGESLPVEKHPDPLAPVSDEPDTDHMVFLGTSIVSGFGIAEVVATGTSTVFGRLASRLAAPRPETALQHGLRQFSLLITRVVVFLVLFVLVVSLAFGRNPLESLLFAVALAVGLTPEFLPMITTIALTQGAIRMARQRVIVKSLPAIESLGLLDVLCTDKTGTLTVGEMQVERVVDITGSPAPHAFALAWLSSTHITGSPSPFDTALLAAGTPDLPPHHKVGEIPFDFERRRATVFVRLGMELMLVTKGAPESVLPLCTRYEQSGAAYEMTEAAREQARMTVEQLSRAGFRVLAVAWRAVDPAGDPNSPEREVDMTLAGFVAFSDPPLPDAGELIRSLAAQGVRVKLLTGDNELVAEHVWRALGLEPGRIVLGSELARLHPAALDRIVEQIDVFARVAPAQKHQIVLALKRNGHAVGFLGDGINDAPSLAAADVGISVVNAADVAREAADVVLLDRRLGTIQAGIVEGRLAFGNVLKFLLMETSSNFGNIFSMAGAVLFLPFVPMLPHQILLNNFLYDLAQITIPRDRVDPVIAAQPHRWDVGLIRRFMLLVGPISSVFDFLTFLVLLHVFHASETLFHSGWFVESLATQSLVVFIIRSNSAPWRHPPGPALVVNVLACVAVGFLLPYSPLAGTLGFVPLPGRYLLFVIAATIAYLGLVELAKRPLFRAAGFGGRPEQRLMST